MKKKVLTVDDNSTNLYLLKSLLEEEGLEVIAAENGKVALDKAHADPPDLIVSDILMPVMDGYTLCRQWKSDEHLKQIPFIFYTATYTEPKDEIFALSLGADRFILKPQEPEILLNILKEVLEEKYTVKQVATKPLGEEMEFFRQYNEILFKKLEKKILDLEIANQKLKSMEEQFRLSFENVTDIVLTIDADFNVQKMSPSVERMLGYKSQDFIGRSVSDLVKILAPESMERAMEEIRMVLSGQTIPASVYSLVARDGTIRHGEFSGSPIRREGEIVGMVSVIRDITERKQAEEELRKKDEEIRNMTQQLWQTAKLATMGELASSIAHELNNPLATVSIRIESLMAKTSENDPSLRELEIIGQEVERMGNLVTNLLQFSRRSRQQISTIDVCEEIEKTLELIHYHLRKYNIKIVKEFAPAVPMIHADRQQLRQLFLNLFTNASDAMPQGGTLTLRVTAPPDERQLLIEIVDTGVGIPPDILPKVTEPFYTTKPEGKGTGLGLAICRRIVQEHSGKLEIMSEGIPGKGTKVCITLPFSNGSNSAGLMDE